MVMIWPLLRGRGLIVNRASSGRGVGPLTGREPLPVLPKISITGITRDSSGNPLGNMRVTVYRVTGAVLTYVETLVSDGSGNYTTSPVSMGSLYQITTFLAGSPDVAGVSRATLIGT